MIMMTTTTTNSHYRSMALASAGGRTGWRRGAGRNAVARGKNPAGTQRISGPNRTFNNNSGMSKAIKTAPKATAVATTTQAATLAATTGSTRRKTQAPTIRTVTVRREHDRKDGRGGYHKADEPTTWDEMLSARTKNSSQPSLASLSRTNGNLESSTKRQLFDPLRTLEFLIAELNSQLKTSLPEDKMVRRILHEIRAVTKRIESTRSTSTSQSSRSAKVTSGTNLMQTINRVKCYNSSTQTNKLPPYFYEKAVQTEKDVNWHSMLSQSSIESSAKWDDSPVRHSQGNQYPSPKRTARALAGGSKCKSSGENQKYYHDCGGNLNGMDDMNTNSEGLAKCRQEISGLKNEIVALKNKLETTNTREAILIPELENRCKLLQNDLETLKDIVKRQTNELNIVRELSVKLQETGKKINVLEKSKLEADRILLFTKLEKEKLAMLQRFQANQCQSLTTEINSLTKVVRNQIKHIQSCASNSTINHPDLKKLKSSRKSKTDETIDSSSDIVRDTDLKLDEDHRNIYLEAHCAVSHKDQDQPIQYFHRHKYGEKSAEMQFEPLKSAGRQRGSVYFKDGIQSIYANESFSDTFKEYPLISSYLTKDNFDIVKCNRFSKIQGSDETKKCEGKVEENILVLQNMYNKKFETK